MFMQVRIEALHIYIYIYIKTIAFYMFMQVRIEALPIQMNDAKNYLLIA